MAEKALTIAASTASMAAAGAALGPWGALGGAAVGLGLGIAQANTQEDAEKEAKRLAKKQKERERKALVAQEVAERRGDAQATEQRNRAIKEGRDPRGPRIVGDDQVLAMSMSAGPGTPYDQYLNQTYGKPFSA